MRSLLACLALIFGALIFGALPIGTVSVAAPPARDWTRTTTQTAAGAFVTGNPAARVKLVEYGSYTCPHCAAFAKDSAVPLAAMIRSGSTSVEYRHLIRDQLDLAAAMLARCTGTRGFAATSAQLFATQGTWLPRGYDYLQANGTRLALYPQLAQVRAVADGAGLIAFVQARGLTPAATDACFADAKAVDRILAMTAAVPAEVTGTPAFFINGRYAPGAGWTALEPLLRARGAR